MMRHVFSDIVLASAFVGLACCAVSSDEMDESHKQTNAFCIATSPIATHATALKSAVGPCSENRCAQLARTAETILNGSLNARLPPNIAAALSDTGMLPCQASVNKAKILEYVRKLCVSGGSATLARAGEYIVDGHHKLIALAMISDLDSQCLNACVDVPEIGNAARRNARWLLCTAAALTWDILTMTLQLAP